MAFSTFDDNYEISSDAIGVLQTRLFKYHHHHYKTGQQEFENWVTVVQDCSALNITLQSLPARAKAYMKGMTELPTEQLYNLQRWLRGRQVCYCHHLQLGNANDEHLYPITTARELVRILRPDDSEDIVAECTPVNLTSLVEKFGSDMARGIYGFDTSCSALASGSSPLLAAWSPPRSRSPSSERENKYVCTSQRSWRSSSSNSSVGESTRSRSSSLASIMSKASWRS